MSVSVAGEAVVESRAGAIGVAPRGCAAGGGKGATAATGGWGFVDVDMSVLSQGTSKDPSQGHKVRKGE